MSKQGTEKKQWMDIPQSPGAAGPELGGTLDLPLPAPCPAETLAFRGTDRFPAGEARGYRVVRLDHIEDRPPAVRLTVWLADGLCSGPPHPRVSLVRIRDDVDHGGFMEVFRHSHDNLSVHQEAWEAGKEVDRAKLEAMELVAAHCIHGGLARVARRCSVCAVHEIRGGDVEPSRVRVHIYEVPLEVVADST